MNSLNIKTNNSYGSVLYLVNKYISELKLIINVLSDWKQQQQQQSIS